MEILNVTTGAVELTIDGDQNRVIRFYPTDVSFAEAYYRLADRFGALRAEVAEKENKINASDMKPEEKIRECVKLSRSVYDELRTGIDDVFGAGTYDTVFGEHENIGMVAKFFFGVSAYVRAAREKELSRYKINGDGVLEC